MAEKQPGKHAVALRHETFEEARMLAMVLGISTSGLVERAVRNELAACEREDAPPEIRQAVQAVRLARRSFQAADPKRGRKA